MKDFFSLFLFGILCLDCFKYKSIMIYLSKV
jgi:hypothetical protein